MYTHRLPIHALKKLIEVRAFLRLRSLPVRRSVELPVQCGVPLPFSSIMLTFRLAQFHPIVRPFVEAEADIKRQRSKAEGRTRADGRTRDKCDVAP